MGSGDPSGLQNRRELALLALVSSTLTRFRQSSIYLSGRDPSTRCARSGFRLAAQTPRIASRSTLTHFRHAYPATHAVLPRFILPLSRLSTHPCLNGHVLPCPSVARKLTSSFLSFEEIATIQLQTCHSGAIKDEESETRSFTQVCCAQ